MKITRILVVDDEPPITRFLKKQLEATERFEVRAENSGHAAIRAAREFKPDVVLLDVMMPDLDGGEVKSRLLQLPECRGTLVVFLTALYQEGDHNNKDYFLAKPVDVEKVTEFIDQHWMAA